MKLWIVGSLQPNWAETGWSIVGLFDNEPQARMAAARGNQISQIEVNRDYGDEMMWPQQGDVIPGSAPL